jgi:hypothetical protein
LHGLTGCFAQVTYWHFQVAFPALVLDQIATVSSPHNSVPGPSFACLLACLLGGLVAMRYCTRFPPSLFSCDYGYTIFAYWVLDVLGSRLCARENA